MTIEVQGTGLIHSAQQGYIIITSMKTPLGKPNSYRRCPSLTSLEHATQLIYSPKSSNQIALSDP